MWPKFLVRVISTYRPVTVKYLSSISEKHKLSPEERESYVILDPRELGQIFVPLAKGNVFFVNGLPEDISASEELKTSLRLDSLVYSFKVETPCIQVFEVYSVKRHMR